ncbi:unknown [Clostridium sp. CAG:448]|nr:unknown [Clostridium sp. CAG:448]
MLHAFRRNPFRSNAFQCLQDGLRKSIRTVRVGFLDRAYHNWLECVHIDGHIEVLTDSRIQNRTCQRTFQTACQVFLQRLQGKRGKTVSFVRERKGKRESGVVFFGFSLRQTEGNTDPFTVYGSLRFRLRGGRAIGTYDP